MSWRPRGDRWRGAGTALTLAIALTLVLEAGGSAVAQDVTPDVGEAPPERPAALYAGSCEAGGLAEIVVELSNLTLPPGDEVGQTDRAVPAQASFTSVPLSLDALLAEDHAVNVRLSPEEDAPDIACGEIGGILNATGSLVVGLKEVDSSGYGGIAFLAPGADGASTNVSLFLAPGLAGDTAVGGGEESAAATPTV